MRWPQFQTRNPSVYAMVLNTIICYPLHLAFPHIAVEGARSPWTRSSHLSRTSCHVQCAQLSRTWYPPVWPWREITLSSCCVHSCTYSCRITWPERLNVLHRCRAEAYSDLRSHLPFHGFLRAHSGRYSTVEHERPFQGREVWSGSSYRIFG